MRPFYFSGLFKSIASFNQRLLDDVYLRSHFTRENLHSVMQRNVQRILGTSLGLLLSAILLMIPLHLYKQSVSLVFCMQLLKDSLTETMRLPAFYYPDVLIIIKSCTTASH